MRVFAGIFAVTLLALLSVGAVLPVLPRYVRGPLDAGDVAVGVVIGAYAVTGLFGRARSPAGSPTRGAAARRSCSARCSPRSPASSTWSRPGWRG